MLSLVAWCGSTNLENKLSKFKVTSLCRVRWKVLWARCRVRCTSLANITLDANECYTTTKVDMFRETLKHVKIVVERHIDLIF